MSKTIVVIASIHEYKNGKKELVADYALDFDTLEAEIVPMVPPGQLGAKFDVGIGEWVINV